ncbi:hypothetical protein [Kineococcus gypseus]|uniref:hypothetical protein n=1 Tax=Kineococcus gypseus TaxID=1637102 RepID=UPI003D7EB48D
MNEVEERLRRELAAAVQDVQAPAWLVGAARAGGRRRLRRRRALLTAPAAAAAVGAVGVGALVQGGWPRPGGTSTATPAGPAARGAAGPAVDPVPGSAPEPAGQEALQQAARAAVQEAAALDAYFAAGYDYDDAVELGRLWNVEPDEAKTTAGAHLLAGEDLPFEPVAEPGAELGAGPGAPVPPDPRAPQREAFFAAGYDYDDAVRLAELWRVDSWEAKALAGERLLAGQPLPLQP